MHDRNAALTALAALGFIGWLALRGAPKKDGDGDGTGGGGGGGAVTFEGGVEAVSVRSGSASMRSHHVQKAPGQTITVSTTFFVSAKNGSGSSISWNYRLTVLFGHNTLFGWKTSGQLGFTETGAKAVDIMSAVGGTYVRDVTFTAPTDPDQEWDVRVQLLAEKSDANGIPIPDDRVEIATGEHVGAVTTLSGVATVQGSVSSVSVSQLDPLSGQPGAPDFHPAFPQPARPGGRRPLLLRARRGG